MSNYDQVLVAHTCNPSYLEAENRRIMIRGQLREIIQKPHIQNNQSKMYWSCDSSCRAPAMQVQSPEFKPQSHERTKRKERKKKRKREKERKEGRDGGRKERKERKNHHQ
jgi:hypothetical protein